MKAGERTKELFYRFAVWTDEGDVYLPPIFGTIRSHTFVALEHDCLERASFHVGGVAPLAIKFQIHGLHLLFDGLCLLPDLAEFVDELLG
jgi:hypothetical protein